MRKKASKRHEEIKGNADWQSRKKKKTMIIFAFVFVLLAGVPLFAGVGRDFAKTKTKIRIYTIATMVVSHCRWGISRFRTWNYSIFLPVAS